MQRTTPLHAMLDCAQHARVARIPRLLDDFGCVRVGLRVLACVSVRECVSVRACVLISLLQVPYEIVFDSRVTEVRVRACMCVRACVRACISP